MHFNASPTGPLWLGSLENTELTGWTVSVCNYSGGVEFTIVSSTHRQLLSFSLIADFRSTYHGHRWISDSSERGIFGDWKCERWYTEQCTVR
ncbi:hypothetical protein FBUS_05727 [Fasciolopsis buskii]|uniref:Uncharacterized protein n=1 Tax=Fasciolopsis buskii TaxID=27845 RepID=A0A8E0S329_9TREM|nr:hypothetical protein FBUS_05727 [Fasciolopsis buski]